MRSGKDRNANVRMLVSDDGTVRCNKKKPVPMGGERLLTARELARDLEKQAALGLELPPEKGSILSYRVRLEEGTIAFSDRSRGIPKTFSRVVAFTSDIAGASARSTAASGSVGLRRGSARARSSARGPGRARRSRAA